MTVRYKYRLDNWDLGRKTALELSEKFGLKFEEREETVVVYDEDESIFISFFMDPREFVFVKAKISEDKKDWFEKEIEPVLKNG